MKYLNIILFVLTAITAGCECVPDIVTPKIISPDEYSNALIINSIPDREILTIESNDIPLLKKSEYITGNTSYQHVNSGVSYLRLIDESTNFSLVNMPVQLNKSDYYTVIFYGYRNSAKAIILKDTVNPDSLSTGTYFRFVHTSFDTDDLIFKISDMSGENIYEKELSFKSFTELKLIASGKYNLLLINPNSKEVVYENKAIQFETGKICNIVLKGTYKKLPLKPLFFDIVQVLMEK